MFKFTVKRSKWLRGIGPDDSYLYNTESKKMCCLGFFACAVGHTKKQIADVADPYEVKNTKFPPELVMKVDDHERINTEICKDLMEINDSTSISDAERESELKTTFRKAKITVSFED